MENAPTHGAGESGVPHPQYLRSHQEYRSQSLWEEVREPEGHLDIWQTIMWGTWSYLPWGIVYPVQATTLVIWLEILSSILENSNKVYKIWTEIRNRRDHQS